MPSTLTPKDLLQLKQVIEENYTDGIDAILGASLDKEGHILGTARAGKQRLAFRVTDTGVAVKPMDSLKPKQDSISFTPPPNVRAAFKEGLELHAQGKTGNGIEPATIAWARKIAKGQPVSPQKVSQAVRWFGRNSRFASAPKDSPAYASWCLWGKAAGRAWFNDLYSQMNQKQDATEKFQVSGKVLDEEEYRAIADSINFDDLLLNPDA